MTNPFRKCNYCGAFMLIKKLQGRQRTIKGTRHPVYVSGKGDINKYACLDCEMEFDDE